MVIKPELRIDHICSLVRVSIDIPNVEAGDGDEEPEHPLVICAYLQVERRLTTRVYQLLVHVTGRRGSVVLNPSIFV